MRRGLMPRGRPLVIHTWNRPSATSRLDCWSSAVSVPLSVLSGRGSIVRLLVGEDDADVGSAAPAPSPGPPSADEQPASATQASRAIRAPRTDLLTIPTLPASGR